MPTEHEMTVDEAVLFQRLNLAIAGESAVEGVAAVQNLYCAMLCMLSDDAVSAADLARRCHDDVQATIRNNFNWYKSQQGEQPNAPAGRG